MSRNLYIALGGACALLLLVGPLLAQRDGDRRRPSTLVPTRFTRNAEPRLSANPKIIEMGWDQLNTSDLSKNIAQYEKMPFDGVVLGAFGWEGKTRINFNKEAFGHKTFTKEEFQTAVNQLRATHFKKFTDNFLRINIEPGDVDWFDDAGWDAIVKNAAVASWICKEGKLKGIMFDTEEYNQSKRLFYYQHQPNKGRYSFEQYVEQARKRGRDFGAALASEKTDPTILFTYTGSYINLREKASTPLAHVVYGLLPAFIDGMMEGTSKSVTFVDGLEPAYGLKDRSSFEQLHQGARDAKQYSLDSQRYGDRMQVGIGMFLDMDWEKRGWDPNNTSRNYYQPDEFEKALEHAMAVTDKYVWIYTQKINWWANTGISEKYVQAMETARANAGHAEH